MAPMPGSWHRTENQILLWHQMHIADASQVITLPAHPPPLSLLTLLPPSSPSSLLTLLLPCHHCHNHLSHLCSSPRYSAKPTVNLQRKLRLAIEEIASIICPHKETGPIVQVHPECIPFGMVRVHPSDPNIWWVLWGQDWGLCCWSAALQVDCGFGWRWLDRVWGS